MTAETREHKAHNFLDNSMANFYAVIFATIIIMRRVNCIEH